MPRAASSFHPQDSEALSAPGCSRRAWYAAPNWKTLAEGTQHTEPRAHARSSKP